MEEQKNNLGPESPADLQWSQGAKNPRKETKIENDEDKLDMINIGTLDSDTDDDDNFLLILKDDIEKKDDIKKNILEKNNDVIGTPFGDTATSSNEHKRSREHVEENNTETKKQKTNETDTEYYLRVKDERNKRREAERLVRLEHNQNLREDYSVHKKIYDEFLENLNERSQEIQKRNYLVECLMSKPKVYNKVKRPLTALFCQNHLSGTVNREQARLIQDAIVNALIEYYKPYREDIVRFEEYIYDMGYFRVRCTDFHSLQFLKTLSLKNVWPGSPKIYVLTDIDFAPLVPVTVIFRKKIFEDFDDFLKLIVFQNREVDPRRWVFVDSESREKELWHLKLDAVSFRHIKSLGGHLFCGAEEISFDLT